MEGHKQFSDHELATRKRTMTRMRRVTVVAPQPLEERLSQKFNELGASGYTATPCHGAGRTTPMKRIAANDSQIRLEAIVTQAVADDILDYLRIEVSPHDRITVCKRRLTCCVTVQGGRVEIHDSEFELPLRHACRFAVVLHGAPNSKQIKSCPNRDLVGVPAV